MIQDFAGFNPVCLNGPNEASERIYPLWAKRGVGEAEARLDQFQIISYSVAVVRLPI